MLMTFKKTRRICVAAITVALLGLGEVRSQDSLVFDLEWDGPETSTVAECIDENYFCYTLQVLGSIEIGLESDAPSLINFDSDILIPPQLPNDRPITSPNLWSNFDLLQGEYLTTIDDDDISMVFRPAEVGGILRAYEIFVNITDSGQSLELTGGIEQSAASPLEPDLRFSVSGQLVTSDLNAGDIVDGSDFLELQLGFGALPAQVDSDRTGDGVVTQADIQQWQAEFGTVRGLSISASVGAVPEPSSVVLAMLLTATGLVCFSRRPS